MNFLDSLPPWAAALVGALALASAVLVLVGALGLLRLGSFYKRVHAPTLGTTFGTYLMLAATLAFFHFGPGLAVPHVLLIGACVVVTAPISLMLLVRAALARDRKEGVAGVEPVVAPTDQAGDARDSD